MIPGFQTLQESHMTPDNQWLQVGSLRTGYQSSRIISLDLAINGYGSSHDTGQSAIAGSHIKQRNQSLQVFLINDNQSLQVAKQSINTAVS
jgi:hypothetical protein